jgi:hypothetical protein
MTKDFARPPPAGEHCRHYEYDRSKGPTCARGVDLSNPGSANRCMPSPKVALACQLREEHTPEERAAWQAWRAERQERMFKIIALIPGSSMDKKNRPEWGKGGIFDCPACDGGKVRWARSSFNGHMAAGCTTPMCFQVQE